VLCLNSADVSSDSVDLNTNTEYITLLYLRSSKVDRLLG
jgi:hypothetical protein